VDESGFVTAARGAEEAPHTLKIEVLRQRPAPSSETRRMLLESSGFASRGIAPACHRQTWEKVESGGSGANCRPCVI
jgi:hypothetical protein